MTYGENFLTPLLLWAVTGLLAIVNVLVGFIVHLHMKSDDEYKKRIDKELEMLRKRLERRK